jgi:hypothetical protein
MMTDIAKFVARIPVKIGLINFRNQPAFLDWMRKPLIK